MQFLPHPCCASRHSADTFMDTIAPLIFPWRALSNGLGVLTQAVKQYILRPHARQGLSMCQLFLIKRHQPSFAGRFSTRERVVLNALRAVRVQAVRSALCGASSSHTHLPRQFAESS